MEYATFISCLAWILRGYAAKMLKYIYLTYYEINEMKSDPMVSESMHSAAMYEEEDDLPVFGDNIADLMKAGGEYPFAIDYLSDDYKEDYLIKDTDALIVAGKVYKYHASLEIYIYEQSSNNLFVHHEIMLSSFPLDLQWLRVSLGSINSNYPVKGNYAIVSSFLPEIYIWNLDLVYAIYPDMILGGYVKSKKKKPQKFTNQSKKYKEGSHTDSILSLSLNHDNLAVLASGSADHTVKIWDLTKYCSIHTSVHHKGTVKKVQWSPVDVSVLFSCSDDGTISIVDSRYPNDRIYHTTSPEEQLYSACWNINQQTQIAYVTNQGNMKLFDVRKQNKILISQQAHKGQVNDIKIGSKNMCYTCGYDQNLRVWNLNELSEPIASKNPHCVHHALTYGTLFCLDLMEQYDGPIVSAGNSKGELFVWETTENYKIYHYWSSVH